MKKALSSILIIAMLSNITVFAVDNNMLDSCVDEIELQSLLNAEVDERMITVYEQLEAQDALEYLPVYEDILYSQVEWQIRQSTIANLSVNEFAERAGYLYWYFPYGGTGSYKYNNGSIEVAVTCLDYDNSYYYILSQNVVTAYDIIMSILGYIPVIGTVFSSLVNLETLVTSSANASIIDANGYAMIVSTKYSSDETSASVLMGWSDAPYYILHDGSSNRQYEAFEYHNPWE